MRILTIVLAALLVVVQYPLWLGKGGWMRVWDLDRQLTAVNRTNDEHKRRNDKLAAEVKDLKEGAGAVEERARYELGMLKEGEMFVEVSDPANPGKAAAKTAPAAASSAPTAPVPATSSAAPPKSDARR